MREQILNWLREQPQLEQGRHPCEVDGMTMNIEYDGFSTVKVEDQDGVWVFEAVEIAGY